MECAMYIPWTPRMQRHPQPAPALAQKPEKTPPFDVLAQIILRAIEPFPEARLALVNALVEFRNLGATW